MLVEPVDRVVLYKVGGEVGLDGLLEVLVLREVTSEGWNYKCFGIDVMQ